MRKPKTNFGLEIKVFTAKTGMTAMQLAENSGVNYGTLLDVSVGRCPGHEIIPKVRKYMNEYIKENKELREA